jgi:hypothetical protein
VEVPERIVLAVKLLRSSKYIDAAAHLKIVLANEEFRAAEELGDFRLRALTLYAQCLSESGQLTPARLTAEEALAAAKTLGDTKGEAQCIKLLRDISAQAMSALKAKAQDNALSNAEVEDISALLAEDSPPATFTDLLTQAQIKQNKGKYHEAKLLAKKAAQIDQKVPRDQVLVSLLLAHLEPACAQAHLNAAWACASDSGDHNLIHAIGRTAGQLGLEVGVLHGPDLNPQKK